MWGKSTTKRGFVAVMAMAALANLGAFAASEPPGAQGKVSPARSLVQRGQAWWPYATTLPPYNGKMKATEEMKEEEIRINDLAMLDITAPEAAYATMPADLVLKPGSQLNQKDGYYLIKIEGATRTQEQIDALTHVGAVLGEYLHINTYIAKIPSSNYAAVKGLPFVTAVLDYHPAYKISPQIGLTPVPRSMVTDEATGAAQPWTFELALHAGADVNEVLGDLAQFGIYPYPSDIVTSTYDKDQTTIFVKTSPQGLPSLAKISGVKFIIEHAYPQAMASSTQPGSIPMLLQNNGVYTTSASGWKLWNAGIKGDASGTAQIVTMMDSGLAPSMYSFSQDTWNVGTIGASHRKVVGYDNYGGDLCVLAYSNTADYGHGGWTSQTAVGGISNMTAHPDTTHTPNANWDTGAAPNGKVYMQDVGTSTGALSPPTDLGPSIAAAIGKGSYIQNHSWGTSSDTYDTTAADLDAAIYANPGMVVTVAAGNGGAVGTSTIGSPSTSKNCICVGGVDAAYPNQLFEDCAWDGTTACASTDLGSARGPGPSSRTKPDICAYITNSGALGNESQWAGQNPHAECTTNLLAPYWDYDNGFGLGGTSFSAPEVAGLAALTRDYFMAGYYPTGAKVPANALTPSGTLVKAIILASGEPLGPTAQPSTTCSGCSAIGLRPSSDQGWGRANLPAALHLGSGAPYLWVKNNAPLANGAYDTWNFTLNSNSTPLRVMLVWYDKTGSALVDNLDLAVTIGANTYKGNVFSGGWSTTGGSADATNPQEGVFLNAAAGLPSSGTFSVKVTATSSPDAVPYSLVVVGPIAGNLPRYGNMSQGTYLCHRVVSATIIDSDGTPTNAVYHSTSGAPYPAAITGGPGTWTVSSVTTDQLGAVDGDQIWLTFTGDDGNPYTISPSTLDCSLNVCVQSIDPLSGGCDNDPYMDDGETLAVNVSMVNNEIYDTPTGFTAQLEVDPAYPNANIKIVQNAATWRPVLAGNSAYADGVPFYVRYTAWGGGPVLCHFRVYNITATDSSWTGNGSCAANSFTEYANANVQPFTTYVNETFDNTTFPPTDQTTWTNTQVAGTGLWVRATTMTHPAMSPQSGNGMAEFVAYSYTAGCQARLATGPISFTGATMPQISFWMTHDLTYTNDDTIAVQASTNGTTWATLQTFHRTTGGTAAGVWINHAIDLKTYNGQSTVYIGFLATGAYGDNMAIDSVLITNSVILNDLQVCSGSPALGYNDGDWMFDDGQCNSLSDWTNFVPSPDAGESGSLIVYVGNTGNENAYDVTGTLTCPTCPTGVSICKSTAAYGTIPYGTGFVYGPGDDGFTIAIAPSVAATTPMPFVLTLTGSNIGTTVFNTVTSPSSPLNTIVGTPTIQGNCTSPYASITGTTTDVAYDNFQMPPSASGSTGRCGFTTGWTVSGAVTTNTTTATPTGDSLSASISATSLSTGSITHTFSTVGMDDDVAMHCTINYGARTTSTLYWEYTPDGTTFYTLGQVNGVTASTWGSLGPFSIWYAITSGSGTGFGPAAAAAILNNPNFGIRFRATNTSGTARTFLLDDVEVDMTTHQNQATSCTGICAVPDTPSLDLMADNDPCSLTGVKAYFTGNLGTSSFNLVMDGSVVVTGYTAGATYTPGDASTHSYQIQAVNSNGTATSAVYAFADSAGTGAPTITAAGGTLNTQTGYTGYQWYKDGVAIAGATGTSYTPTSPTNCGTHLYKVAYKIGACTNLSAPHSYTGGPVGCCSTISPRVPVGMSATAASSGINVTIVWDSANCPSANYHILYGKGENLPAWAVDGGKCSIGTSGMYDWIGMPDPSFYASRFLWFLVVGDQGPGCTVEGSWGTDSSGNEEGGALASGVCGMTSKFVTGSCQTP